jgi:hypothetical protein
MNSAKEVARAQPNRERFVLLIGLVALKRLRLLLGRWKITAEL